MFSSFFTTISLLFLSSIIFINGIINTTIEKIKTDPLRKIEIQEKVSSLDRDLSLKKPLIEKEYSTSTKEGNKNSEQKKTVNVIKETTIEKEIIDDQEPYYGTEASRIQSCKETIFYTISDIDPRFEISKKTFLETLNYSASLWNQAAEKNLFLHDEKNSPSSLRVSLVYDGRQEKTKENKLTGAEINNTKEAAETIKKEYEAMKNIFSQEKNTYTQRTEAFLLRQKKYNDTVTSWNEKGGAPPSDYEALTIEKKWLTEEAAILTKKQEELTSTLEAINSKIAKYNVFVGYANEKVTITNNSSRKKFTEGLYNPNTNSIIIYQFNDTEQLKRVLTHELGHALQIGHLTRKESIMYPVNIATSTELSREDILALESVCNKQ